MEKTRKHVIPLSVKMLCFFQISRFFCPLSQLLNSFCCYLHLFTFLTKLFKKQKQILRKTVHFLPIVVWHVFSVFLHFLTKLFKEVVIVGKRNGKFEKNTTFLPIVVRHVFTFFPHYWIFFKKNWAKNESRANSLSRDIVARFRQWEITWRY